MQQRRLNQEEQADHAEDNPALSHVIERNFRTILAEGIAEYQAAWHETGHPGQGEARLRLPIYVAEDMDRARSEPQASAMPYYERVRQAYLRSANTFENPARAARAARLATLTYADVLQTRVVFGTPTLVTERLSTLRHEVGLSGIIWAT